MWVPIRRAALPLVPTTANGRIAQKLREKEDTLSLENEIQNLLSDFPSPLGFSLPFSYVGDDTICVLSSSDFNNPQNAYYVPSFPRFDIRHYLGRPFSSFL